MKFTDEEIEHILGLLEMEVGEWEDGCGYVEYEMTEKSYLSSRQLFYKLNKMIKDK